MNVSRVGMMLTDQNFQTTVLESSQPVLVAFTAEGCAPWHLLAPEMAALAESFQGQVTFATLDVEAQPQTPSHYGIGILPALLLLHNGAFATPVCRYDKVLDREALFEFKRAIGLAAHGTGVGSFVYLRRIFENLISQTFQENKKMIGIEDQEFFTKRMEDRVEALESYLPSHLIEMRSIYSILSKGIHELSEKECLTYFEPMKLSIELILDQKIELDLKRRRDQKVKNEIQKIHQKLG